MVSDVNTAKRLWQAGPQCQGPLSFVAPRPLLSRDLNSVQINCAVTEQGPKGSNQLVLPAWLHHCAVAKATHNPTISEFDLTCNQESLVVMGEADISACSEELRNKPREAIMSLIGLELKEKASALLDVWGTKHVKGHRYQLKCRIVSHTVMSLLASSDITRFIWNSPRELTETLRVVWLRKEGVSLSPEDAKKAVQEANLSSCWLCYL